MSMMRKIKEYKEYANCLVAYYMDGAEEAYEKPAINVFENYGEMIYIPAKDEVILGIHNSYDKDKIDWIVLKRLEGLENPGKEQ